MRKYDARKFVYTSHNTFSFISIAAIVCVFSYAFATNENLLPSPQRLMAETVEAATMNDADENWQTMLINAENTIPQSFSVELYKSVQGWSVDVRIKEPLENMLADAKKAGINLHVLSSYRSQTTSAMLYQNKVAQFEQLGYTTAQAKVQAAKWVAPPMTSEHHTGLALDIVSRDYYDHYDDLVAGFENFPEFAWLAANSAEYGFVLRYPKEKQSITGISYEPWHYRYVGVNNAKYMNKNGLCLEEFRNETK